MYCYFRVKYIYNSCKFWKKFSSIFIKKVHINLVSIMKYKVDLMVKDEWREGGISGDKFESLH